MISTGSARVCDDPELLGPGWQAARYGLITNHVGVLPDLTPSAVALRAASVPVVALWGREYGLFGTARVGRSEASTVDTDSGPPVFDTCDADPDVLVEILAQVDCLLWGSDELRLALDSDCDPARLLDSAPTGIGWAGDVLLYE
jgi:Protein of unknown function (DUF1343)